MKNLLTLKNCKAGDIIITDNGDQAQVMKREANLIYRSAWWRFDTFSEIVSVSQAEKAGWKIIQKHGQIPMTVQEAEMFIYQLGGKHVKIIQ